jgi:zinc transporter
MSTPPQTDPPVTAILLDGEGGSRPLTAAEAAVPQTGIRWMRLDYTTEEGRDWLRRRSNLPPATISALLAEDPRPRSLVEGDGMLLVLRGVNTTSPDEPEDMVAVRLWIEPGLIVTVRRRALASTREIRNALEAGRGPRTEGEFLVDLMQRLLDKLGLVVTDLDAAGDELEEKVITAESRELRSQLGALRRQAIALRRYVAPQRDTVVRLHTERVPWLSDIDRGHLRESADRIQRYIEDLDSARDRAAVTQEELSNRLAESTNRTMYTLSVVAAIFLPLGLLTGLLGINVGGMPGVESPYAFWVVSGILVALAIVLGVWFRRQKLL